MGSVTNLEEIVKETKIESGFPWTYYLNLPHTQTDRHPSLEMWKVKSELPLTVLITSCCNISVLFKTFFGHNYDWILMMILLFQVCLLFMEHFASSAHIFVPVRTQWLVRGPGQHRQWPGLAQMVQGRPAPSPGSHAAYTESWDRKRNLGREREREIMRWPVSSGMLGMEDRIRQ